MGGFFFIAKKMYILAYMKIAKDIKSLIQSMAYMMYIIMGVIVFGLFNLSHLLFVGSMLIVIAVFYGVLGISRVYVSSGGKPFIFNAAERAAISKM